MKLFKITFINSNNEIDSRTFECYLFLGAFNFANNTFGEDLIAIEDITPVL